MTRRGYAPDYLSVQGVHAPRRLILERLVPQDASDADALPTVVARSRIGVRLLTSARHAPMPFTVRNVESDEIHFIQSGQVRFDTEVGSLQAEEGDFVCIPRSVAYRYAPIQGAMRSMIVECPSAASLTPPAPFGMINFARDVRYPKIDRELDAGGPGKLVLKTADEEVTTFVVPHDPLALGAQLSTAVPVWKLSLASIQLHTYEPHGGPPSMFLSTRNGESLMFNLSARSGGRPPVHVNADFDEVILYVRGPGAYGACTEPGTLTWVPKGVIHHGPSEAVPDGYQAWLLETRATLRFTPEALAASELMETGNYGPHPTAAA
ncbi:homogentisate 1,2-dioxygenase [Trinickia terrae]|uniref:Homogentisate 1,2-dioxygenase n=1 Tax=Trinickia terrae TaxID=2571161 RepID=A0A4U1IG01_9BURK|nr:homogentisate 1,2-dioxygenase [Trinickia terrae]